MKVCKQRMMVHADPQPWQDGGPPEATNICCGRVYRREAAEKQWLGSVIAGLAIAAIAVGTTAVAVLAESY